ncbi:MAG: CapA family protein [Acidimicrobiia bacterium]|nr:CapA family protein [Acidimicrobiia bacterium]
MAGRYSALIVALALWATACTTAHGAPGPATVIPPAPITTLPATTTTTTVAPTTTSTVYVEPVPVKQTLVINGTGDVNLDPTFVRTFPKTGYEDAWTGLFGVFLEDDLTVVNLECSPSLLGSPWDKTWNFRCDPEALPSMAAAGVDVANLANNHGMDYGMEAMLDGRQNLLAVGIAPVGTGANRAEAYAPFVTEVKGWRIAVIGSGGVNPETGSWIATDDTPGMTSGDDTESISAAIREAKKDADIVIVTAHWGKSYEQTPKPFEINQAKAWVDAGADGVFGHHQHHLQPLMWYEGKPIALGLGNFVWQAYPASAKRTAIAQFVFEPDGHISACLVDVVIERNGHPVLQNPDAPICETTAPH